MRRSKRGRSHKQIVYKVMKRLLLYILVATLWVGQSVVVFAQDSDSADAASQDETEQVAEAEEAEEATAEEEEAALEENPMLAGAPEDVPMHEQIKIKFIEGGPEFMGVILLLLVLGLAISIERIIYLNLAVVNTSKFLTKVESALQEGGMDEAKEICRKTRGPVASIFYQGLDRAHMGLESVEKSVVSYGSVQMSQLESGLTWINLFIALAPTFGFMGTVIGMISAFDAIEIAGDIAPSLVAGGIKIALITTVFGLIVAAILQLFYNYLLTKIDSIVMNMEDASISLIDILVRNGYNK